MSNFTLNISSYTAKGLRQIEGESRFWLFGIQIITVLPLQIVLTHSRIGKLYRAYKDMEDVGINFAEFDYNQKDYVGEGTHLMPGSR